MSKISLENADGFDVPEEGLWEERFRDALATGDELGIGKLLRKAKNLGPSTIEALANLFEGRLAHGQAFDAVYDYRLVLVKRSSGRPKDPIKRSLRDQEVANFVRERLEQGEPHKIVMHYAELKFRLKRSSVTKIMADSRAEKRPDAH